MTGPSHRRTTDVAPGPSDPILEVTSTMERPSTALPSRRPVSTSSRATSSRLLRSASISISMRRPSISTGSCVRSTRACTCTSCGMATSKSSAVHRSRWCSCSTTGSLAADRRHPQARHNRGTRPPAGRRAHRAPQGNRRARHARRPCPQRWPRVSSARPDRRDDDAGKVQPRYAPRRR